VVRPAGYLWRGHSPARILRPAYIGSSPDRDGHVVVRVPGVVMSSSDGEAGKEPASASSECQPGAEGRGSRMAGVPTTDRHSMLRAFAHRDYRLFFSGQLVSLIDRK